MLKKVLICFILGVAIGCTFFVVLGMIFTASGVYEDLLGNRFILHAIGCMVVGVAFSIPSIIYESEKFSLAIKTLIHMGIGFIVYFPVSIYLGWMPIKSGSWATIVFIIGVLIVSFIFWGCFAAYYKEQAKKMNEKICEKQRKLF